MKHRLLYLMLCAAALTDTQAMDVRVVPEPLYTPCLNHMPIEDMLSLYAHYVRLEVALAPIWRFEEGEYESILEKRTVCERQLEHPCSECHRSPLDILRTVDMDMLEKTLDEVALVDYRAVEHRLCHFHHPSLDAIRAMCDRYQETSWKHETAWVSGKALTDYKMRKKLIEMLQTACRHCRKSPLDILSESHEEMDARRLRRFCYLKHTPLSEILTICFRLGPNVERELPRYVMACQHCGKTALDILKESFRVTA